jgi:hypothetical protein
MILWSVDIEVPVEDLLNPPSYSKTGLAASGPSKRAHTGLLLRPMSNHPHTSKVDADSEAASSVRVSLLSRSLALREQPSSASMASGRSSIKSSARSITSRVTTSTVSVTPQANKRARRVGPNTISPARRFANEVRAKDKGKERPDSKLTPSIVKPEDYLDEENDHEFGGEDSGDHVEPEFDGQSDEERSEGDSRSPSENLEDQLDFLKPDVQNQTPVKKVLITRASLASVKSATGKSPSDARLKSSASQSTLRSSVISVSTKNPSRPNSRGSTRSSRLNVSVTGSGPRARAVSRPISRLSSVSTSVSPSTKSGSSRPTSSISTSSTTTTDTLSTFRTAGSTATVSRSRRPSAASSVQRPSIASSPVQERVRKISSTSVSSIASTASRNSRSAGNSAKGPSVDPGNLNPVSTDGPSTTTLRTVPIINVINEHRKTGSSASTSSIATLKRKSSTDTIKTLKSSSAIPLPPAMENPRISKALPPPPPETPGSPLAPLPFVPPASIDTLELSESVVPRGATLEVGIPCIISSNRKRFKAYARYIGEVEGETGPWVGVELPIPIGDSWADTDNMDKFSDERQWHDGSWGGIRYFEIGGLDTEMDYSDDRAPRRRRLDGSVGGFSDVLYGRADSKGMLKREGDQLSITSDRMKRMRSASPAVSDMSGTESRGLFVRPSQVIYVVDAVGADL